MAATKCPNDLTRAHDYFKFDEASIVCRRCGEQRVVDVKALIAQIPQPIYLPCPGPHYPPYQRWAPWWGTTTSGGTTWKPDQPVTVTYSNDDNATYGPESVS